MPARALKAHGCAKVERALLRPWLLGRAASRRCSKGVGAVVGVHLQSHATREYPCTSPSVLRPLKCGFNV